MTNVEERQPRESERLRHLPKNLVDVYVWYSLAALDGVAKAEVKARALRQRLTAGQLRQAAHELAMLGGEEMRRVRHQA